MPGESTLPTKGKATVRQGTVNDRLAFNPISCYVIAAHSRARDL